MSKFSMFSSVKASRGTRCTREKFNEVSTSSDVVRLCQAIAAEPDHDKQGELKKQLPCITFQAYFPGARKNELAEPSGLFFYDGDKVENPYELYVDHVVNRLKELGIVYAGMTPSTHGLRLVARMRPEFASMAEAQEWLGKEIGWEPDKKCKDMARASYMVPLEYVYYMHPSLFEDEPVDRFASLRGTKQTSNEDDALDCHAALAKTQSDDGSSAGDCGSKAAMTVPGETSAQGVLGETSAQGVIADNEPRSPQPKDFTPDQSLLFKGLPLTAIAHEWLLQNGGEPEEGERNDQLHKLALRLRHITDYNEAAMLAVMPRYGLGEEEMKTIIHSACKADRTGRPRDLQPVLDKLMLEKEGYHDEEDDELSTLNSPLSTTLNPKLSTLNFPLPPLFKQIANTAPDDFVAASIISLLPMLGTLGSKLRARYLDGCLHSPSFQVSLEAPQASGKSFMSRICEMVMTPILNRDAAERQKEQEYQEKVNELKVTNVKLSPEEKKELLGQKPKGVIRYVPATISITKLLQRLDNARGLHLFALAEEIDTVTKAFKRGFSSYGDLLRVAFDNGLYGQDYAAAESFSGMVTAYYNTLFSGTPKAMRRFYPDVEDGLVSRVCFVMLPDQFGKPMPVWGKLSTKDQEEVKLQLERLDKVSIVDNTVQPDHVMDLTFLNRDLKKWLEEQQQEAVRTNDRTRDVFCRRSAVVGFRAGMLAWFLYGEKDTYQNRRRTTAFARWVANQMLTQHLLRFEIEGTCSNVNRWEDLYGQLPDEFGRDELSRLMRANGVNTPMKNIVYKWRLLGCIVTTEVDEHNHAVRFKKAS